MKPPSFDYVLPHTVEAALRARSEAEDSVVLAGGQSLVPTMNFRLANPETVIDVRRIGELAGIRIEDGVIRIGAMTRQRTLELDGAVFEMNPLVRETLEHVAHPVIRNRGTVGGSLAHADPAAELPCLMTALDARFVVRSAAREREIPAEQFFEFVFTTAIEPDELLTEVVLPELETGEGWAFREFARRHGDFAVAGVAGTICVDRAGTVSRARLAACGIASTPVRLHDAEKLLIGQEAGPALFRAAAEVAQEAVTAADDTTATADYRRHLVGGLVADALARATARTGGTR